MAEILQTRGGLVPKPDFTSGDEHYGDALAEAKRRDYELWASAAPKLLLRANENTSTARQVFLELRGIREAGISFISASPVADSLDKILASTERPPDTPYEGGMFWISVKFPTPSSAPLLRFQTRIYHPDTDHVGKVCADYESWWSDPDLGKLMGMPARVPGGAWFSKHHFSLGVLLTALCDLLANPNIEDPLVPENVLDRPW